MAEWTNCEAWFTECGLDPERHEMWLGDIPPTVKKDKKVFWICHEAKAMANKDMFKDNNVVLFDSGVTDDETTHPFMLHWWLSVDANKLYKFTDRIKYHDTGLKFDALLGTKRPHRDFAWQWLQHNTDVRKLGYITYHRVASNKDGFHVDRDVDLSAFKRSSSIVQYQGGAVGYCSMIPTEIYSQTYISLVAETYKPVDDWSFLTEKISKPMLAKRPFIVLSNRYYLRRLKSLGFKTFDGVIDESYDSIADDCTRWTAALTELKKLTTIPREQLLEMCVETLEHNQQLINHSWMDMFKNKIRELA